VKILAVSHAVLGAACLLAGGAFAEDSVFIVSPSLNTKIGFESNRYLDETEDGSGYGVFTPSVSLSVFDSTQNEYEVKLRHSQTRYLRDEFGKIDNSALSFSATKYAADAETSISLELSRYSDSELPADDHLRLQLAPSASFFPSNRLTLSVYSGARAARYDSAENQDGEALLDWRFWLEPEASWLPSTMQDSLKISFSLYLEAGNSNQIDGSWQWFGASAGASRDYGPGRYGVSASWKTGNYEDATSQETTATLWGRRRFQSWLEATAGGGFQTTRFSDGDGDYDAYWLEAGLEIFYDLP